MITGPNNSNSTSNSAINKYTAESKAGKTSNAQGPVTPAQTEAVSTAPTTSANNVSFSNEARMIQKLSQEISSYPSVDAERVAKIKVELASGGFNINSGAIAQKMMLLDSLY